MSLSPETCLANRYKILSRLGAGGMGEVYRATDLRLGRDVAIKVLPEHLASNPDSLARFEREARAIAALSHPNILAIHDFGNDNGISFAVMELLEGENLRARFKGCALPWRKSCEIALAIAEGLSAAHSKGVIHRDLKPDNIFLTSDGQIKILDFGLAQWKQIQPQQDLSSAPTEAEFTKSGIVMGTVPYMSPEQVRGISVDTRSDIFSFGCVLYEMITGTHAFAGSTAADTMAAILKEDPKELDGLKSKIPLELARIVEHCLAKNPEQRFQSVRDIAIDLKPILSEQTVVPTAAVTPRLRMRPAFWAGIVLVLIVVTASIFFFTQHKPIQSVAILPFTNESNDPNAEYFSDGITDSLINTLSQLPNLKVIARSTAFNYKNQKIDPQKIGKDLKVEAVVMGRVKEQGNLLIINADLIRVSDGAQLWGETYHRTQSDVIALQENISKEIAENLRLKVSGIQKKILEKRPTENAEAYRLYLKGMYFWWKNTIEDYEKSLDCFQKAIDLDPTYPLAYVGLGNYYMALAFEGLQRPKDACPRAEAAFQRAGELDPYEPAGINGLGCVNFFYKWKWEKAERDLKLALKFSRDRKFRSYAQFLLAMGRIDEALKEMRVSVEADPLSRMLNVNLGQYLIVAKRYDEAIEQLKQTIEMDPNYDAAHFSLANAYEHTGLYDEAISEYRKGYLAAGDEEAAQIFETAEGQSGYRESIKLIADGTVNALLEMSKEKYISPIIIAKQYAQLDNKEEAFQWLEKAFQERSTQLVFLKTDPNWDNLRSDPRFADLMRRVGLP